MHITKITRVMLNEKNLPNYFWVEAVAIAIYIMNQTTHNNNSWHDT